MSDEREQIVLDRPNGKMVILTLQEFNPEMEVDEILRIDYGNIMGELLTFPVLFNRIANLQAEMASVVAEAKLDTDIFEAQLMEEYRKKLAAGSEKGKVTAIEVENALKLDARYRAKKTLYIKHQKNLAYLDSLYWSAKSKDDKLNKLSDKLRPEDMDKEVLEGVVNGILIKFTKKSIL